MPLHYEENKNLEQIMPILDEYTLWYNRIVEYLSYPDQVTDALLIQTSDLFLNWVNSVKSGGSNYNAALDKLSFLQTELLTLSRGLVHQVKEARIKPAYTDFLKFRTTFEEFLFLLRRIEKDFLQEETGYDALTGLRHYSMLVGDVEKEMHRLERHGRAFSIAMVHVLDFKDMCDVFSAEQVESYIRHIAQLIKLSVRSFDDAYYMGGGEFVLSLKQADSTGGIAALDRLRNQLVNQSITYKLRPSTPERKLSMACCILEPTIGDSVTKLIYDLRDDLQEASYDYIGSVLEYRELSPLQKMIQNKEINAQE